jgi:hypothetical protein
MTCLSLFGAVEVAFKFIPQEFAPRQASSRRRLTRLSDAHQLSRSGVKHPHVPHIHDCNSSSPNPSQLYVLINRVLISCDPDSFGVEGRQRLLAFSEICTQHCRLSFTSTIQGWILLDSVERAFQGCYGAAIEDGMVCGRQMCCRDEKPANLPLTHSLTCRQRKVCSAQRCHKTGRQRGRARMMEG